MPEILTGEEQLFANLTYDNPTIFYISNKGLLEKYVKRREIELIGHGAECTVISQHGHDHRVTAFKYSEVESTRMVKIFYVQRILSTLFPHNFPHFYTTFNGDRNKKIPPGSIRQKINVLFDEENILNRIGREFRQKYEDATKYIFRNANQKLTSLGVPVNFDLFSGNYNIGPDGGEYYLDTPILDFSRKWNKQKIIQYMRQQKTKRSEYSDIDIRLVSKSIDRLKKLGWN